MEQLICFAHEVMDHINISNAGDLIQVIGRV